VRRLVTIITLTIGLAFGGLLATAGPAAAHHTHSPTSACASITAAHPSLTPISYHSHYDSVGHPVWAHCVYRSPTTFVTYDWCKNYRYHTVWNC
jgi:hypothetical protein